MRASGRTTRLADKAIQDYFSKGVATIKDHTNDTSEDSFHLLNKVINRLAREHKNHDFKIHIKEKYFKLENSKFNNLEA